ncbi:hypothetical protein IKI14_04650 [bacterium]|nr:hypothetical protein [bacterium]
MNPDSSYMFNMLKNLKNVDMSEWKTNRVTNME